MWHAGGKGEADLIVLEAQGEAADGQVEVVFEGGFLALPRGQDGAGFQFQGGGALVDRGLESLEFGGTIDGWGRCSRRGRAAIKAVASKGTT